MIGLKPVGIETAGKAIKHSLPCLDLEDPLRDRLRMNWGLVCLCAVKNFCVTCVPEVGDGSLSWKRQNSGHQLRRGDIFFRFQQSPFPQLVAPPVMMATSGSGTTAVNGGSIVRCRKKSRFARSGTIKTLHKVQQFQKHDMSLFMISFFPALLKKGPVLIPAPRCAS